MYCDAAMKRQHHGCLPSQTSVRAMAERRSLLLRCYFRHPSKCNTSQITGVEMRQRGLAGLVRRALIGNDGDGQWAAQTGSVRIVRAGAQQLVVRRSADRDNNTGILCSCNIVCWVDVIPSAFSGAWMTSGCGFGSSLEGFSPLSSRRSTGLSGP